MEAWGEGNRMRGCTKALGILLLAGCASLDPSPPSSEPAPLVEVLPGWREFALPGKRPTRYLAGWDGPRRVVHARADASASMLRRRVRVESGALGGIEFSWRVTTLVSGADLTDVDASDSPVRIVLAFDGDPARLSSRNRMLFELAHAVTGEAPPYATLMYVWDNQAAPESVIPSRRTDRVRKIVLESGPERRDRWLHYRRDVVADFRRAFGEEPGALLGVALMTDADNTRASAEASYGEVRLLAPDGSLH
jgi:hypothetical protein